MKLAPAGTIQHFEPVSKALSLLRSTGQCVLVMDGKRYLGLLDERQIYSKKIDTARARCGKVAVKTPVLSPSSSIGEICDAFFAGRFKTLPVMEGEKLLGTVGRFELLSMLLEGGHLHGHKVREHMTSPILTVDAGAPVNLAHALMQKSNVRRLAVVENGKLVGLISVFDLLKVMDKPRDRMPQKAERPRGINAPVFSFMKKDVENIAQGASMTDAVQRMLDKKVSALIVTDDLRPVGILTAKDVFETVMHESGETRVFVSGLHDMDKGVSPDIMELGEELLHKLGKGAGAHALAVHVKKVGSEYMASAHLRGDCMLRATATEYTLMDAVRSALDGIKTQMIKTKTVGMGKRGMEPE
ncbi:MAG: CBS domain-containing protein [Candidatus Micrarchaeota archaeon]